MSTFWGKENKRGLKENTIDKKSCDLKSIICHEADCYDKLPVWSVRNILNLTKVDLESCGISVETIWWPDLFWYWDSCLPHVTLHVWLHQWRDSQYWHTCFSPRPHPPRWLILLLRLLPLPSPPELFDKALITGCRYPRFLQCPWHNNPSFVCLSINLWQVTLSLVGYNETWWTPI